jgi:hypothetical protein
MGRRVRRVPLDFDWPTGTVWSGYLMPNHLRSRPCPGCDGTGYSPHARHLYDLWYGDLPFHPASNGSAPLRPDDPAVREFAERNVARSPGYYGGGEQAVQREAQRLAGLWNGMWCHHLNEADVAALLAADRLYDFTKTWTKENKWQRIDPPVVPTPEQVNEWSLRGFGHDDINASVVVRARCGREGMPVTCGRCDGQARLWRDDDHKAAHEEWQPTDPPTGDGWQLWETVSEGSPISPVCPTADALAAWMADPTRGRDWLPLPAAQQFVQEGWSPTLVATPEAGVTSGAEWVGMRDRTGQ